MDVALRLCLGLTKPAKLLFVVGFIVAYMWLFVLSAGLFEFTGWLSIPLVIIAFLILSVTFLGRKLGYIYFAACLFAAVPIFLSTVSVDALVHDIIAKVDRMVLPLFLLTIGLYCLNGVRQGGPMLLALVIAASAFGLAWLNDDKISQINVEHQQDSKEVENARQDIADADAALKERLGETGGQTFLEQGQEDAIDWEGMTEADAGALRAKLEAKKKAQEVLKKHGLNPNQTYKDRKVEREVAAPPETGEDGGEAGGPDYESLGEEVEEDATEILVDERSFTVEESIKAREYSGANKLVARMVVYMAFLLGVVAYFRQFNWTFPYLAPIPVGGRWLDELCPKESRVYFQTADADVLRYFFELTARKGETFIYFGEEYLTDQETFPIVVASGKELPMGRLPHIRDDDPRFFKNSDFVFESAWFRRAAFSIKGHRQVQGIHPRLLRTGPSTAQHQGQGLEHPEPDLGPRRRDPAGPVRDPVLLRRRREHAPGHRQSRRAQRPRPRAHRRLLRPRRLRRRMSRPARLWPPGC